MAIDSSPIESQIDSNLTDNITRQNKASVVRYVLKTVVRWVRDAVNGNLSTWLRTSDNSPGGSNTEFIYRTGGTEFRGAAYFKPQTPNSNPLAALTIGSQTGLQVIGVNGGPAFMEFHLPGNLIHQLGVDTDGIMKFHPWGVAAAYPMVISGLTPIIALPNTLNNRKIILYDLAGNDHQFYGFGIQGDTLRYQVLQSSAAHVFYAGTSPATSNELMRIAGSGNVSIGDSVTNFRLKVVHDNPANGYILVISNSRTAAGRTGAKILFDQSGLSGWTIGNPGGDVDAFTIEGNGGAERMRINSVGEATFSGAALFGARSKAGWPTAAEVPVGKIVAYKNTSSGERRLYWNDAGTMVFVGFGT